MKFLSKSSVLPQYDGSKVWSNRGSSFQGIYVSVPDTILGTVWISQWRKKDLNVISEPALLNRMSALDLPHYNDIKWGATKGSWRTMPMTPIIVNRHPQHSRYHMPKAWKCEAFWFCLSWLCLMWLMVWIQDFTTAVHCQITWAPLYLICLEYSVSSQFSRKWLLHNSWKAKDKHSATFIIIFQMWNFASISGS